MIKRLKCSKTFQRGRGKFNTATAAEMIAYLQQFPGDIPLIAVWQGTTHGIDRAEVVDFRSSNADGCCDAIVFDVEYAQPGTRYVAPGDHETHCECAEREPGVLYRVWRRMTGALS